MCLRSGGEEERKRRERARAGRGTARARMDSVSEDDDGNAGIGQENFRRHKVGKWTAHGMDGLAIDQIPHQTMFDKPISL